MASNMTFKANLIPNSNLGFELGSLTKKWKINGVENPQLENDNTEYTFVSGTNSFTVTPTGGSEQTVTVTPSITDNITGSGTSGKLVQFNGTNTITDGPAIGSDTTTYLRNDGNWTTPVGTYELPTASSEVKGGIKIGSGLSMTSETMAVDWTDAPVTSVAGKTGDVSLDSITIGSKTYDGSTAVTVEIADLGLASTTQFLGITDTTLTNGATTSPINIVIGPITGSISAFTNGDIVMSQSTGEEFIWTGDKWNLMGLASSWALANHIHGNILNNGSITSDTAKASGQHLVMTGSTGDIIRSNITLGSTTTTYLANDGTWRAAQAGSLNVTETTPTAATSYYPIYTAGKSGVLIPRASNRLRLYEGISNSVIYSYINIGDNTHRGGITMHQGNGFYTNLITSSTLSANRNIYFPNNGGTVALTGDIATAVSAYVKKSGDTMTGKLYINASSSDVSLTTDGIITIGDLAGENISIDANEIMARNNGATRQLLLNWEGGGIGTKGNSTFYGNLALSSTNNPTLSLTNSDMDTHASSLAAAEYSSIYFYDKNSSNNLAAFVQCGQATAGNTYIQIAARRRDTANSANITNHITLYAKTDGTMGVGVADPAGWRSAIGAAASSHGTHVSFASSGTPAALGTASHGSASTVARSDHVHAKPSLSDLGAAASSHTHSYLPLSGGTMTGTIAFNDSDAKVQRIGRSKSWVAGRDGALVRITSANAYSPGVSIKTTNGTWEIGHYNAANFHNALLFTYITDTNYNSASNTVTRQYKFQENGTIVGNIDTANKWATARTLTIGSTGKSVDGSGNVSWSLSEIGAAASSHTHSYAASNHNHDSTYVNVSGDTMTGNLTVSKASALVRCKDTTTTCQLDLQAGNNGNHGIQSNGYWNGSAFTSSSKWIIYRNTAGNANTGLKLYGAVWNDYAECRNVPEAQIENPILKPGMCVKEVGDGIMIGTEQRLERGCKIISDTFGFNLGEIGDCKTPIAVAGRVLAYLYEDKEKAKQYIGWPVCSGPNGTVSIMTEEEEEKYPSRIIGTISEIPNYEIWHCGDQGEEEVKVDGRIWIYVK